MDSQKDKQIHFLYLKCDKKSTFVDLPVLQEINENLAPAILTVVLCGRHPTFTPWPRDQLMPQELIRRLVGLGNSPASQRYPGHRRGTLDLREECGQVTTTSVHSASARTAHWVVVELKFYSKEQ